MSCTRNVNSSFQFANYVVRLTTCSTLLLLASTSTVLAANSLQMLSDQPPNSAEDLVVGAAGRGLEPPNLRKILYPTYAHALPSNGAQWSFNDVNAPGDGPWSPMSRYANLFDRSLRSAEGYVVVQDAPGIFSVDQTQVESEERPEFAAVQPGFLPFYSGRGR